MKNTPDQLTKSFTEYNIENRILGISGSPRKNGNSDSLLKHFLESSAKQDVSSDSVYLRDLKYSSCIGCERCRRDKLCTGLKDEMTSLYPSLLSSRGLVLVSPSHNYNITAWMKAFVDRLYCFYEFENSRPRSWSSRLANQKRKVVIIGICEQEEEDNMGFTVEAMRKPLTALGYEIFATIPVFGVFDRGVVKNKPEILDRVKNIGLEFGHAIKIS